MPPTPPELCCCVGMALILIGSHDTHAATQFGEREGNRFPSLLRLVSLLNHNLPFLFNNNKRSCEVTATLV